MYRSENFIKTYSTRRVNSRNTDNNLNFNRGQIFTESNRINNNNARNLISPKSRPSKLLIIIISSISFMIILGVLIPTVILKKDGEGEELTSETNKNSEPPRIFIEEINPKKYCIYSTLKIKCNNLEYFPEIEPNDISLEFPIEDSTMKYHCDSINGNFVEKKYLLR